MPFVSSDIHGYCVNVECIYACAIVKTSKSLKIKTEKFIEMYTNKINNDNNNKK